MQPYYTPKIPHLHLHTLFFKYIPSHYAIKDPHNTTSSPFNIYKQFFYTQIHHHYKLKLSHFHQTHIYQYLLSIHPNILPIYPYIFTMSPYIFTIHQYNLSIPKNVLTIYLCIPTMPPFILTIH